MASVNHSADTSTDSKDQLLWTGAVTVGEELANTTPTSSLPDPQYYDPVYQSVAVTLSSIVFTVGFVGNVLVVIVIARSRSMHTTTNCYLLSLSVADCLVLLAGTLPAVPETFFRIDEWPFGRALCSILIYCQYVGVDASSLSITAFTIERYIAICHPIRAQTMCTVSRAKRITGGLWLFTTLYCGPWLGLTDLNVGRLSDGSHITKCQFRLARSSYLVLYMFDLVAFYILPFLITTVLYCLIARILVLTSLQHARDRPARTTVDRMRSAENTQRHRHSSKWRGDSRVQVIRMLVVVVVVFATLWMPYRVMVVYNSFAQHKFMDLWFLMFSRTLIYINCAINPILYNVMSVKFRRAFKSLLCCGLRPAGTPVFLYSEMGTATEGASQAKRRVFSNRRLSPNTCPSGRTTDTSVILSDPCRPLQRHKKQTLSDGQGQASHPLKVILLEWIKGNERVPVQTTQHSNGYSAKRVRKQPWRTGKEREDGFGQPGNFHSSDSVSSSPDRPPAQQGDDRNTAKNLPQRPERHAQFNDCLKQQGSIHEAATDPSLTLDHHHHHHHQNDTKHSFPQSSSANDIQSLPQRPQNQNGVEGSGQLSANHFEEMVLLPRSDGQSVARCVTRSSDHCGDIRLSSAGYEDVDGGQEVWERWTEGDDKSMSVFQAAGRCSRAESEEDIMVQESVC